MSWSNDDDTAVVIRCDRCLTAIFRQEAHEFYEKGWPATQERARDTGWVVGRTTHMGPDRDFCPACWSDWTKPMTAINSHKGKPHE